MPKKKLIEHTNSIEKINLYFFETRGFNRSIVAQQVIDKTGLQ